MNYIGRNPAPSGVILVGDSNPVGMIGWFHSPPTGWVRLNGTVLTKAGYPDLWAYAQAFLTLDQVANPGLYRSIDAANFAVPNLDGLFVRATGQVDATHVAAALGAKQADANLSHTHTAGGGFGFQTTQGGPAYGSAVAGLNSAASTDASGGTEARPVNVALVPCVKALPTTFVPVTSEAGAYPPGTLAGATLSNNAVDAVNDIDIAAGKCRATGDVANLTLAAMTKQLDAAWALGSAAGMRATGAAIADGTYHVFAIRRPDTGVVDVAADTDPTGANIPVNTNAAFTQRRRIGSILRVAGSILAFAQLGDLFRLLVPRLDVNNLAAAAAYTPFTISTPRGIRVIGLGNVIPAVNANVVRVRPRGALDAVPGLAASPLVDAGSSPANTVAGGRWQDVVDVNSQIDVASTAGAAVYLTTAGWIDRRGRDDL